MRLNDKMTAAINNQILMEFQSSYAYLAMSAWCERVNFPGTAKWLREQSAEERGHAMKLYDFLADRGATIDLKTIDAPSRDYKSLLDIFEQSLAQEQKVSDAINTLYDLALTEKAFATAAELQWFLIEQVEEEKTARQIVAKLKLLGNDASGLIDIDRELGSRTNDGHH